MICKLLIDEENIDFKLKIPGHFQTKPCNSCLTHDLSRKEKDKGEVSSPTPGQSLAHGRSPYLCYLYKEFARGLVRSPSLEIPRETLPTELQANIKTNNSICILSSFNFETCIIDKHLYFNSYMSPFFLVTLQLDFALQTHIAAWLKPFESMMYAMNITIQ